VSGPAPIDLDVIDRLRQLNQEGEPDVVREVFLLFLDDAPQRIVTIVEAIARRDAADVQRAAHTLKGAAANIGAHALQRLCLELELLARDGLPAGAAQLTQPLTDEFERVRTEIDRLLLIG
jgi:two-component system sensor histidine kinase/response regulator